jgi:hypothetical protein
MAWTSPRTWAVGEIATAALMNTHVRDNFSYLKGTDGTVAIDAGITASGIITATAGIVTGLSISGAMHITVSGKVVAQAGLVTPTHISAAGNINMQAGQTVAGIDISVHATDNQSSHGIACTGSAQIAAVCTLSYTGNGAANNSITHSLGRMPYAVMIQSAASGYATGIIYGAAPTNIYHQSPLSHTYASGVTAMDATNFYVGISGQYTVSMNLSAVVYRVTVIG